MVAVLFARKYSIYKTMPECDVFDIERNALTFTGGMPIVAHPPCRSWGRLKFFSNGDHKEKQLAIWAVRQIRKNGGVLEHPETSTLWKVLGLPLGTQRDKWGGIPCPWINPGGGIGRESGPGCILSGLNLLKYPRIR